jgi:DNA-binding NarL/FixJ family response regulator
MTFLAALSHRERAVLKAVCAGLSSEEIGDELFVCKDTVDTHRRKILEKWREVTDSTETGKKASRQMLSQVRIYL